MYFSYLGLALAFKGSNYSESTCFFFFFFFFFLLLASSFEESRKLVGACNTLSERFSILLRVFRFLYLDSPF